jgi:hypothetical protein
MLRSSAAYPLALAHDGKTLAHLLPQERTSDVALVELDLTKASTATGNVVDR